MAVLKLKYLVLAGIVAFPLYPLTSGVFDPSPQSASAAAGLLEFLQFPVERLGTQLSLPSGTVEVVPGCNGLKLMCRLLKATLAYWVIFPMPLLPGLGLALFSLILGFWVNALRIALLAALFGSKAFNYWHSSQLFSLFSLVLWGLILTLNSRSLKSC